MAVQSREAMLDLMASIDELKFADGADVDSVEVAMSMRSGVEDLIERYDAWYPRCAVCNRGGPTANGIAVYVCECEVVQVSHHGVIQTEMRG